MLIDNFEKHIKSLPPVGWTEEILMTGGIFSKKMTLTKGNAVVSHTHEYDHISILASGRASVTCEDREFTMVAGDQLEVKAGQKHGIIALDDIIWYCVHNEEVALCHGDTPPPP